MREDDETTSCCSITCTYTYSPYCMWHINKLIDYPSQLLFPWMDLQGFQIIKSQNKHKRFQWTYENYIENLFNGFEDMIWTDMTTVQLEATGSCYNTGFYTLLQLLFCTCPKEHSCLVYMSLVRIFLILCSLFPASSSRLG